MTIPFQPATHRRLTPYIFVKDAPAAIAFYAETFDAKEAMRLATPDGVVMHAELDFGDTRLMLSQEMPQHGRRNAAALEAISQRLMLYVADVDQCFQKALAAGATEIQPLQNQFWGDRMGVLCDPFGQQWALATQVEVVSDSLARERFQALMSAPSPSSDT